MGRIESLRERLFREGKWPAYYQQKLLEKANGSQWVCICIENLLDELK